ncbi:unnamed protein product [Clonostachys rosea f. rosea IK726]|uniref:Uncharacterized protein n=1 Tax=Clonostachys rosea f. rosea IK726 TaxID=1349383 RepID=A0ACA9T6N0_BIOOC|nr:unnamed protein product [Clonostachys rosea f. rosea IK726]
MGGTYVQGGMGKPDITFPIMAMCLKEVTVKGSVVSFDQAEEAFKKVKEGEAIKVLIAGPNEKI